MRIKMKLPDGLELVGSTVHKVYAGSRHFIVLELVYVYKKDPRIYYLAHARTPANQRIINDKANPYFVAKALGNSLERARQLLITAFTAHYSRPPSEWNKDVKGNVLLSVSEPEPTEPEQADQGSWRDRPPML